MTRNEYRTKCIKALKTAIWTTEHGYDGGQAQATAAFDSLNSIARVVSIEATEEMIDAADPEGGAWWIERAINRANTTGDLTNPPEKKP